MFAGQSVALQGLGFAGLEFADFGLLTSGVLGLSLDSGEENGFIS